MSSTVDTLLIPLITTLLDEALVVKAALRPRLMGLVVADWVVKMQASIAGVFETVFVRK